MTKLRSSRLLAAAVALAAILPGSVSADSLHLPLLHPEARIRLNRAEAEIAAGQVATGLRTLQELIDETVGESSLILREESPGRYKSYTSVWSQAVDLLKRQPPEVLEEYRSAVDVSARSLYEKALKQRDRQALLQVYERFPLSSIAWSAALAAGDLAGEAGAWSEAAEAWQSIDWDAAPFALRRTIAQRRFVLATVQGDALAQAVWRARAGLETAGIQPSAFREPPETSPAPASYSGAALRWIWSRELADEGGYRSSSNIDYASWPAVGDDWVAVSSPTSSYRFDLATGEEVQDSSLPHWSRYQEYKQSWRQQPAVGKDLLITSYVSWASAQTGRGRRFGVVKVQLPRRSLRAIPLDGDSEKAVRWDTSKSEDDLVARLSFNSTPIIDGDRVYALGWRQSGYVDVYLVALDLVSGKVLWHDLLVSNQVDLTRFGEIASEPLVGALHVEDGLVYACTNLGVVAAARASDGRLAWLTEYRPVRKLLDISERRSMYYPYEPMTWWDRCTIVSHDGTLYVTPLDSQALIAFSRSDGTIEGTRRVRGNPHYFLGIQGEHAILCGSSSVTRVPLRNLRRAEAPIGLHAMIRTRPALVPGGVIYSSTESLHYSSLTDRTDHQVLVRLTPTARLSRAEGFRIRRDRIYDGMVKVLGDRVLITNSFRISCFQLQKRSK